MSQHQTEMFAVGCCFVLAVLIGGIVITELLRKLAREREEVERLRRMNSRNYHHRRTMERAIIGYCNDEDFSAQRTEALYEEMRKAASESEVDRG